MIDKIPVGDMIFLGTGTSHGIPMVGCECAVCTSSNPKNRRTRSSVILGCPQGNLLIDTAPELRLQMVREGIRSADAILFTHHHVDHLFGLDDTRRFPKFNGGGPTPVFCSEEVCDEIHLRFSYIFDPLALRFPAGGVPKLDIHVVEPNVEFDVLGARVLPLLLHHGIFRILGFRVGNWAYCTDVKAIPPESMHHLAGLDTLIIGCLRFKPHPAHMGLDEALAVLDTLRPKRAFFTHCTHDFEHEAVNAMLPENVRLAYDGLYLPGAVGFGP